MAINAKVDNTTYEEIEKITAGGKTVELSEVFSGTKTITVNGTHDVSGYAEAVVDVLNQGTTVSGTKEITENGTYDVSAYASALVNVAQETDGYSMDDICNGSSKPGLPFYKSTVVTNVESIRSYAFAGGNSAKHVTANSATSLGEYVACGNIQITELVAPNVTTISKEAFNGCSKLTKADYPLCTTFSGNFFNCSSLAEVNLPLVPQLEERCFSGCKALTSISLHSVTNLRGVEHFKNCISLSHVELPNASCNVPQNCFNGCTSLEEITLPKVTGLASQGNFQGCTSLKKIDFGDACTSLKATAPFANCTALTTVILRYNGVVAINNGVFSASTNGVTVYVPSAQLEAYRTDSVWSTQSKVTFASIEGSDYA